MSISGRKIRYPKNILYFPDGRKYEYKYWKNPDSDTTVVLLTGALGLADLMQNVFEELAKYYSVLTFDYPMDFPDPASFCQGLNHLLEGLEIENAWLMGQSLGGLLAQSMAARYPKHIQGLILINTGTLEKQMSPQAYKDMLRLIHMAQAGKHILEILPFEAAKKLLLKAMSGQSRQYQYILSRQLSREYLIHMLNMLIYMKGEYGLERSQFKTLDKKTLLMLSKDDHTFSNACKVSLIHTFPHPRVYTELTGGHMALFNKPEKFICFIRQFIESRKSREPDE